MKYKLKNNEPFEVSGAVDNVEKVVNVLTLGDEVNKKQDKPIDLFSFFYNDQLEPRFPTSEENARVLTEQEQELWNKILDGITNKTDFTFLGLSVYFTDPFNMDTKTQHQWQVFNSDLGTVDTLTIHHSTTDDTELFWMNRLIPNDTYFVKNTQLKTINNQSLIGSGENLDLNPLIFVNFWADDRPSTPSSGQYWYSPMQNELQVYNGSAWTSVTLSQQKLYIRLATNEIYRYGGREMVRMTLNPTSIVTT